MIGAGGAPWPSPGDLVRSDLAAWLHPRLRDPATQEAASRLMVDLVLWFVARDCLFLASAVAGAGGGADIVRFDRDHPEAPLAHAVLVTGRRDGDILSGMAVDVLGARPLKGVAAELSVLGRLEPSLGAPIPAGDWVPHGERVMLAIAGCLPWTRPLVPERFRVAEGDAFRALEWIAAHWGGLRDGGLADARWVESLPPLGEACPAPGP